VTGRSPDGSGSRPTGRAAAGVSPAPASIPNAADLARWHEQYGSCDGFGPLRTCSACTGILGSNADYPLITNGRIDEATAADAIGDFLLEKAERAAQGAMSCCDSPAAVADYMRAALIMDFPGNPWRHGDELAHRALALEGRDKNGWPTQSERTGA
jgi:hypothetical protein